MELQTQQKFYKCSACERKVTLVNSRTITEKVEKAIKTYTMAFLSCNHAVVDPEVWIDSIDRWLEDFESIDGKRLFPFQREGVKFLLKNGKGLIADEMGLGKTLQAIATILTNPAEFLPCLAVVPSSVAIQWQRQVMRWSAKSGHPIIPQIISSSGETPMPEVFDMVIVGYDMLWRLELTEEDIKKYRTIILDESQRMKRSGEKDTKRAAEVLRICSHIPHVFGLSGTPFKNSLFEYYNILHAIKPDRFPGFRNFVWRFVSTHKVGYATKYGGLRKGTEKEFSRLTDDIVIRRERAEVAPEIPAVMRDFQYCDLDKAVEGAYRYQMQEFLKEYSKDKSQYNNILQYITAMRTLTSISKIPNTIDKASEILLTTNDSVVIFYHLDDAGTGIYNGLSELCKDGGLAPPIRFVSSLNDIQRQQAIDDFRKKKSRIFLASTLCGGEGVDGLHEVCHRVIMHERQWNPGNEEQAESRLTRFGSEATGGYVDSIYMIAAGTIDDYFTELVEVKRENFRKAMGKEAVSWQESTLMAELFETLATKGLKRWRL